MKFLRSDLLTLLISLFILSGLNSCKNQSDVGLPVGSEGISGTLIAYDDITIKTDTDNTLLGVANIGTASTVTKVPLSSFNDSRLGTSTSSVVTGISLPSSVAFTRPSGIITTDSVILELRYADGFYGDSLNSRYKVNVYQLSQKMQVSTAHYATQRWPHEATNLSTKTGTYNVRPKTAIKVTDIVDGAKDTLVVSAPQLRVPLQTSFFADKLFNTTTAASVAAFQNATKGLYISLQRNQTTETGGTIMLDAANSTIKVYYRADTAGTIDTAVAILPLSGTVAEISHSYTDEVKTAIAGTASNDAFYIQGLAGLRAKLAFPNIKTIFGTTPLNTIAINRAELVITPVAGTDIPFVPQPLLSLYRLDITKQRRPVPDGNGTNSSANDIRFLSPAIFGGNYVTSKKEYHFIITAYIDDLIRGKLVDYGTYIGAIDTAARVSTTGTIEIQPTAETAARLIAVGSNKTSPYRLKLNVIYTKNN